MITLTIHFSSVIIGVILCLAVVCLVIIGSYYTGAWDDGFMNGYRVGKDGQTESCNRDHESDHSDHEKV